MCHLVPVPLLSISFALLLRAKRGMLACLLLLCATCCTVHALPTNVTVGVVRPTSSSGDREVKVMQHVVDEHNAMPSKKVQIRLHVLRPPKNDQRVLEAAMTLLKDPTVSLIIGSGYTGVCDALIILGMGLNCVLFVQGTILRFTPRS